ncbi:MAG: flippase-like domain-containing protein, partial [Gemmatimonadetes bacterium]|nr:flippase-like domain-containing protein [Gemmatimonadota bacterium]
LGNTHEPDAITRQPPAFSTADLLPAVLAGNAGNLLVPHAGEIARAIVANRRLQVPTSALLATVAVERFFDFLALLLIALAALVPVGRMSPNLLAASYVLGALLALILVAAVTLVVRTENCLGFVAWMLTPARPGFREKFLRQLRAGTAGLSSIGRPELFLAIFLLSLLHWSIVTACIALSIVAAGIPISLAAAVSVLVLSVVGLTLPAAPGHVGTIQLAFTVALGQFGVAHADAFAAAVIYNFFVATTGLALGLPGLRAVGTELYRILGVGGWWERKS